MSKISKLFSIKPAALQFAYLNKVIRVFSLQNFRKNALLLPPTDSGSLGDQAMVMATIKNLKQRGYQKITLIAYDSEEDCRKFYNHDDVIRFRGDRQFISTAKGYTAFYCLGADVMDGYYSKSRSLFRAKLTYLSSKVGLKSAILGFSFNKNPDVDMVQVLSALPKSVKLYARDPISYSRLLEMVKGPTIELVADLAFLLEADFKSDVSQTIIPWIRQEKEKERVIIGLNINCKISEKCGPNGSESMIHTFKELITYFHDHRAASFLLIPHDFRGKPGVLSDVEFCEVINNSLSANVRQNTCLMPLPCTAADIKCVCGELDIVLTGRMHLAIAALGRGTPAAGITYQGKFEGLYKHLSLRGLTLDPEEGITAENLISFLDPLIEKREDIRLTINENLPKVKALALKNIGQ